MQASEEIRLRKIERVERGEAVTSPELPAELTAESADMEDNNSWSEEISFEAEMPEIQAVNEEEYHQKMIQIRKSLGL